MKKFILIALIGLCACRIPDEKAFLTENRWKCGQALVSFDGSEAVAIIGDRTTSQRLSSGYTLETTEKNGQFILKFNNPSVLAAMWGGSPPASISLSREGPDAFLLGNEVCIRMKDN